MNEFTQQLFIYLIIIMSAIFHEYAHAWMALSLGDSTAKRAGRLTLNPIPHIDMVGTILLPFFLMITSGFFIGYAKPVPYNPYNLKDQKYGEAKVAIAGPASNFLIALIFSAFIRFLSLSEFWLFSFSIIVYINIVLGLFNLIPVHPFDGSKIIKIFFPTQNFSFKNNLIATFLAILLAFTLLPILAQFVFNIFIGNYF